MKVSSFSPKSYPRAGVIGPSGAVRARAVNLKPVVAALCLGLFSAGCTVMPEPITETQLEVQTRQDIGAMFADQPPLSGPVDLYEAMARAVRFNLAERVAMMEEAVQAGALDLSHWDLLPKLTARAGYMSRSEFEAYNIVSTDNGRVQLRNSTWNERDAATASLNTTWNVLDFGVSFFRARQNANRLMLLQEHRRTVVQNLLREVRGAFFRALAAQELLPLIDRAVGTLDRATAEAENLPATTDLAALRDQKALLEKLRRLRTARTRLLAAEREFRQLINLPPDTPFALAPPSFGEDRLPAIPSDVRAMEESALMSHPELKAAHYEHRISVDETRKTIARMFPGIELNLGTHEDSNDFLIDNGWYNAGVKIAWNLLNLIQAPMQLRQAEAKEDLTRTQRLALAMSILGRLHAAVADYRDGVAAFRNARAISNVDLAIARHDRVPRASSETVLLNAETLLSDVGRRFRLADLYEAAARVQDSVGLDPLPEDLSSYDLAALADSFAATDVARANGSFRLLTPSAPLGLKDARDSLGWSGPVTAPDAGAATPDATAAPAPSMRRQANGAAVDAFAVAAGAFAEPVNAERMLARLTDMALNAFTRQSQAADGRTLTRVYAGPFATRAIAEAARQRLISEGVIDANVQAAPPGRQRAAMRQP